MPPVVENPVFREVALLVDKATYYNTRVFLADLANTIGPTSAKMYVL